MDKVLPKLFGTDFGHLMLSQLFHTITEFSLIEERKSAGMMLVKD